MFSSVFNSLLYILTKAGKHYKMDFFMMQGNKQKIRQEYPCGTFCRI